MSEKAVAVDAWEALFRAQVTVLRELQESFPTGELSMTEYDVLFNLSRQPDRRMRIRDLHKHLLLTQPSVSRMVDRLVVRGLVTKSSDPDDGRGTVVEISQPGYELFRRVAIRHADAIAQRVGGSLSVDELHTLTELCTKLRLGGR